MKAVTNPLVFNGRIQQVGGIGRALCTFILVSDLVTAFFVILNSLLHKKEIVLSFFTLLSLWIVGILIMRQLFVLLTKQELFTAQSARLIQWLGLWQFVWGLRISPIADKLSDIVLSYQIKPGIVLNLKPEFILTGLFLLAFGWAMNEAAFLKQDQDLTI